MWVQSYYKSSNDFIKLARYSFLECNIHKFDCRNIFRLNRIYFYLSDFFLIWYANKSLEWWSRNILVGRTIHLPTLYLIHWLLCFDQSQSKRSVGRAAHYISHSPLPYTVPGPVVGGPCTYVDAWCISDSFRFRISPHCHHVRTTFLHLLLILDIKTCNYFGTCCTEQLLLMWRAWWK